MDGLHPRFFMRLKVTHTDSNDNPTTSSVAGYFEGERYSVTVHSTGTTEQVSEALADHLLEITALEPYEGDSEDETSADEAETASTEDESDGSADEASNTTE